MNFTTQPIKLFQSYPDENGALVHEGDLLVAIVLQLSFIHDVSEGMWFIDWVVQPDLETDDLFGSLDLAKDWLARRISTSLTLRP